MDLLLEIDPAVITHFLRIDSSGLGGAPGEMTARTFDNKRYFGMVIADISDVKFYLELIRSE